ncbi:MAG TPA: MFS transporter [Motilibacteraceae bacterium]|nr:MFS transporter [Motilibacteraceae bacterium]
MSAERGQPRWSGKYSAAVALALLALCPNIVLSTALTPLAQVLSRDLHASVGGLQVAEALSNAGYALGAVVAAALAQRFVQRRLFLGYEAAFVVGSVLAALAPGLPMFFAGRVLQGLATGLMLVAALPPLVTRFGVGKLPVTVAVVNVGLFGATTLGPIVGGLVAAAGAWRLLFAVLGVLGLLGLGVGLLAYQRSDPLAPDLPVDRTALVLATVATVLPFLATGLLTGRSLTAPVVLVPFVVGIAALVALVVIERRKREPLMPVRALSTQLPVTGTVVAMVAGAVFVTVVALVGLLLTQVAQRGPAAAATLFWPMPVGLVIAAVAFGTLFRTRWLPVLVDVGLVALGLGAGVLLLAGSTDPGTGAVLLATFLLGLGAGATVSPGLFLAALGVPSSQLGRAFALVELLRSEAGFAVTPVVLFLVGAAADPARAVHLALLAMLVLAALGLAAALAIPALSGARLRTPDLHHWLDEGEQALPSPATGVHLRPGVEDESAEPLLPRKRPPAA